MCKFPLFFVQQYLFIFLCFSHLALTVQTLLVTETSAVGSDFSRQHSSFSKRNSIRQNDKANDPTRVLDRDIWTIDEEQKIKVTSRPIYVVDNRKEQSRKPTKSEESERLNNESSDRRREDFYRKVHNVPITEDHAMHMFQHWAEQAFSSFFAVIANQKLKEFAKTVHDEFGKCCGKAKTVPMHAKCVSDLLNGNIDTTQKEEEKMKNKTARFDKYRMQKRSKFRIQEKKKKQDWIGAFRMTDSALSSREVEPSSQLHIAREYATNRRDRRQTGVVKKNYYELLTPSEGRVSPMGKIAQMMMKGVLKAKGKHQNDVVPWQKTVQRIKESADKRKAIKKMLDQGKVESLDQLTYRGLKRQGVFSEELTDVMNDPKKLKQFLGKKLRGKGKEPINRFVRLLREGLKLGYAFAGKNTTAMEYKNMKMVSPRFLSVTPEDDSEHNATIDFLSPSLFSLHNSGKGIENLTSIPNILKNVGGLVGYNAQDQQAWLDFIMEAANVVEEAERIEAEINDTAPGEDPVKTVWEKHYDKDKYEREIRAKDGTPLYFTKQNISDAFGESETRKVDMFERLQKMMSRDQVKDMNGTGYALMSREQLDLLYGPGSEYHDPEALGRFKSLDRSTLLAHIERDIHSLAQIKSFKITRKQPNTTALAHPRSRRAVVLSPVSFTPFVVTTALNANPIILSPVIFSPLVLAPATLGPIILSPLLFVPIILAPRVLSPIILSPLAFVPLVLSPLVLTPFILTPGVFVPFILSPLVLDPFILSPQVFAPFVLNPMVLNPFILSPAAASPLVLSPFVLTPIIYSPMAVSALVLSPYVLSPLIQSPLYYFSIILSPSYLS